MFQMKEKILNVSSTPIAFYESTRNPGNQSSPMLFQALCSSVKDEVAPQRFSPQASGTWSAASSLRFQFSAGMKDQALHFELSSQPDRTWQIAEQKCTEDIIN